MGFFKDIVKNPIKTIASTVQSHPAAQILNATPLGQFSPANQMVNAAARGDSGSGIIKSGTGALTGLTSQLASGQGLFGGQQAGAGGGSSMANGALGMIGGGGAAGSGGGSGPNGLLTPGEQQAARQVDINAGQSRFRDLMNNDARVQEVLKHRKDGIQGLNAQEQTAAREQMVKGSQAANQGVMRSLLAQQNKSGIKGGLAAGQQMGMAKGFADSRNDQERKLLLDNYAIKDKAFDKYQDASMGQVYGELAQGVNEAGLGVADRTGYQQALIGQQMAAAAGQQPKKGFLGEIFSGIF